MAINRAPFNALTDDLGDDLSGSMWNKTAIASVILDPADAAYANKYDTVSISTVTGAQAAYAPDTPLAGHTFVEWTAGSNLFIYGIAAPHAGQRVTFFNAGSATIYFYHQHTSGIGGGKLYMDVTSGPTPIGRAGTATFVHDGGNWILVAHEQGAWITPAYNASNFLAVSGGSTWTVTAGAVSVNRYRVSGRALTWAIYLGSTTISGVPTTGLSLVIPNGYGSATAWSGATRAAQCYDASGMLEALMGATGNFVNVQRNDNIAIAVGTMPVLLASLTFEIV